MPPLTSWVFFAHGRNGPSENPVTRWTLARALADVVTVAGPPGTTLMKNVLCCSATATRTPVAPPGGLPLQLPTDAPPSFTYSHVIEVIAPMFMALELTTAVTSAMAAPADLATIRAPA